MPTVSLSSFKGYNTAINPLSLGDGQIIQAHNVNSFPFGAYSKRQGYESFLGTPDNSRINTLFAWYRNDDSVATPDFNVYRASGSVLYYSTNGTSAWAPCGNGTFSANFHIGHNVLNDVLIVGDGLSSTRHSTNGTSFTNTTLAPLASQFAQFQDRIYAMGTANTLFWSTVDDATNWNTSGTSDSSSINIPGEGKMTSLFKNSNTLIIQKSGGGDIYRWDGGNLVDLSTRLALESPYSVGKIENTNFWLNRFGVFSYAGGQPQLVSNPIQRLVYNNFGSGITGPSFGTAPAIGHLYDYLVAVGTTSDDFTGRTIPNAVLKFDVRLNSWATWDLHHPPTAFLSYRNNDGLTDLLSGDANGQVHRFTTTFDDNSFPIQSVVEFIVTANTQREKYWYFLRMLFNPGCEAQIEICATNDLSNKTGKYTSIGQAVNGVVTYRFPSDQARGKYLFVKISDNSTSKEFYFYGAEIIFDVAKDPHE